MPPAVVSRWSRRYVATGLLALVCWQAALLADPPRRTAVVLGLYGFVLLTVLGKATALVPTYFDRELAPARAPAIAWPLSVAGVAGLAAAPLRGVPPVVGTVGAVAWGLGVLLVVGSVAWTIRDNLTGRETATGTAKADRRPVDRVANAAVPVALGYLLLGSYATVAGHTALPPLLDGYVPRRTHLLAAGCAALLVFALGARLIPRFLVADLPRWLVATVLVAGSTGPAILAAQLASPGVLLAIGATLEAVAVLGYAVGLGWMVRQSDRRRVGRLALLAGAAAGVLAVGLGLVFAVGDRTPGLLDAHWRLVLAGFLGLTIVGVETQFYPPAVGRLPGAGDRTALAGIGGLAGGVCLQAAGRLAAGVDVATGSWPSGLVSAGELLALAGAIAVCYALLAVFAARR